jgi:hypothetical protein
MGYIYYCYHYIGVTLDSFYGKKEEEETTDDMASVVKRRHLMVGKVAELKRKQEEELQLRYIIMLL